MQYLYFPEEIYFKACKEYMEEMDVPLDELKRFCENNHSFFVEVAFAFVEGTDFPLMKEDF